MYFCAQKKKKWNWPQSKDFRYPCPSSWIRPEPLFFSLSHKSQSQLFLVENEPILSELASVFFGGVEGFAFFFFFFQRFHNTLSHRMPANRFLRSKQKLFCKRLLCMVLLFLFWESNFKTTSGVLSLFHSNICTNTHKEHASHSLRHWSVGTVIALVSLEWLRQWRVKPIVSQELQNLQTRRNVLTLSVCLVFKQCAPIPSKTFQFHNLISSLVLDTQVSTSHLLFIVGSESSWVSGQHKQSYHVGIGDDGILVQTFVSETFRSKGNDPIWGTQFVDQRCVCCCWQESQCFQILVKSKLPALVFTRNKWFCLNTQPKTYIPHSPVNLRPGGHTVLLGRSHWPQKPIHWCRQWHQLDCRRCWRCTPTRPYRSQNRLKRTNSQQYNHPVGKQISWATAQNKGLT